MSGSAKEYILKNMTLQEAIDIIRPLADAAEGYEDHAPDDQGCGGLTLADARRARDFLRRHEVTYV